MGVAVDRLVRLSREIRIPAHPSVTKAGKPYRVKAHLRTIPDSVLAVRAFKKLVAPPEEGGGGFSINKNGYEPKSGYMVALTGAEEKFDFDTLFDPEAGPATLDTYKAGHAKELKDPHVFFGGWLDAESRIVYLDLSERFTSREEAVRVGKKRKQLGIYDVKEGDTVRLSKQDATEVIYLPKDDTKAAWEMLVAAMRAADERTGYKKPE